MLSPTAGKFFAVVKSFDNNIAVIGNFVLIAKNWNAVKQDTNVHLIDVVSSTFVGISNFYIIISNWSILHLKCIEVYWRSLITAIKNVPV